MNKSSDKIKKYDGRYAIVASRFTQSISDKLVEGAQETLAQHGIMSGNVNCFWVPGAFEVPFTCKKLMSESHGYSAIIALGAVIRGDTSHFDYVAGECARGIAQLNLQGDIPVIFGVLTADTLAQAQARSSADNNKGAEAALAAMQMVHLLNRI